MLQFFKKKPSGKLIELHISGMHCTSCAINIDGSLEDIPGVTESTTTYSKSVTRVIYDPQSTNRAKIVKAIQSLGYAIVEKS